MASDIQLNLINQSNDISNSSYVIFQKNSATDVNTQSVAWIVVKNLGLTDNHRFLYPMNFEVGAQDSNGNNMPLIPAQNGDT